MHTRCARTSVLCILRYSLTSNHGPTRPSALSVAQDPSSTTQQHSVGRQELRDGARASRMRPIFRGGTSSKCVRYISRPTTKSLRTHTSAGSTLRQQWKLATALVLGYLTLTLNASTAQGQMDPAEIQRQMEQQMEQQMRGGSQGGHGAAAPNRVGASSNATFRHFARRDIHLV